MHIAAAKGTLKPNGCSRDLGIPRDRGVTTLGMGDLCMILQRANSSTLLPGDNGGREYMVCYSCKHILLSFSSDWS